VKPGAPDGSSHRGSGLILHRFENSVCGSNTYVICPPDAGGAWVIDPGDAAPVVACLRELCREVIGILLTHSHHDHIYGTNEVQAAFPFTKVYTADASVAGLFSDKLNMSRYFLRPYILNAQEVVRVGEGSRLPFMPGTDIIIVETPGHHPGAVSFAVSGQLFTGDALLPSTHITTVLPGGDRAAARRSVSKLLETFGPETWVHPGHGEGCRLGAIDLEKQFRRTGAKSVLVDA
jgi:glyoxylase-like metal-dependent hydrolase (beta-lactamase superfamily II)